MTVLLFCYLLSAVLVLGSAALREREVPAQGAVGRGHSAHLVGAALAASVAVTATLTFARLIELAG